MTDASSLNRQVFMELCLKKFKQDGNMYIQEFKRRSAQAMIKINNIKNKCSNEYLSIENIMQLIQNYQEINELFEAKLPAPYNELAFNDISVRFISTSTLADDIFVLASLDEVTFVNDAMVWKMPCVYTFCEQRYDFGFYEFRFKPYGFVTATTLPYTITNLGAKNLPNKLESIMNTNCILTQLRGYRLVAAFNYANICLRDMMHQNILHGDCNEYRC